VSISRSEFITDRLTTTAPNAIIISRIIHEVSSGSGFSVPAHSVTWLISLDPKILCATKVANPIILTRRGIGTIYFLIMSLIIFDYLYIY
jgi:hypothetical protein